MALDNTIVLKNLNLETDVELVWDFAALVHIGVYNRLVGAPTSQEPHELF
jgi:hypothetical protein